MHITRMSVKWGQTSPNRQAYHAIREKMTEEVVAVLWKNNDKRSDIHVSL